MNLRKAILIGLITATAFIIIVTHSLPAEDDYSVKNPKWNGLTNLETKYNTETINPSENLQKTIITPSQSTLLTIGPTKQFTPKETKNIEKFLKNGGRIILADDYGSANNLLKQLNVSIRFSNLMIRDPIFKLKNSKLPTINNIKKSNLTENVSSIAFNYGTVLENLGTGTNILASSSERSYLTENAKAEYEQSMSVGPFPVMARKNIGDGQLVLLSDSSVFINSMIGKENNKILLDSLIGDRMAYLDVHHWKISTHLKLKRFLIRTGKATSKPIIRYSLLFLATIVIFKLARETKEGKPEKKENEIEKTLKKHPDWEKTTLEQLKQEKKNEN